MPHRSSDPTTRRSFVRAAALAAAPAALPRRARALADASTLRVGHVQHAGDWNPRPTALRRLGWEIQRRTSIEVAPDALPVRLADPGLHRTPMLYLTGTGALPPFSEAERSALRRFLQYGGFML